MKFDGDELHVIRSRVELKKMCFILDEPQAEAKYIAEYHSQADEVKSVI